MSITINGATNTLTAASGLTIAGNVAATALNSTPIGGTTPAAGAFTTLSSTGTLGVGGAAAAWYIAGAASIGGWIDIGNGAGTATGSILSNAYAAGVADWRSRQGAFGSLRFDLNPDLQTFSWFTAPTVAINTALTWTQRMSLSTTGLAVTGTLSASGDVTFAGATSGILNVNATGTNVTRLSLLNDGGQYFFGVDNSTAAGFGGTAYAQVIYAPAGRVVETSIAGTGVITKVSSTGLAVTGALSVSSNILPTIDNTSNLGSAALGMKELFCDNGTINTSDARRKTEVSALSAAELNAAKQLAKEIGSFKFLAAMAEKGDAARLHIGMTVQRAIEIMEANGLDPFAYSFICHDAWDQQVVEHPAVEAKDAVLDDDGNVVEPAVEAKDAWTEVTLEAGDKYSFRVHELLLFMAAGFEARLSALEAA